MRILHLLLCSAATFAGCTMNHDTLPDSTVPGAAIIERCTSFMADHGGDPENCKCFAELGLQDQTLAEEMLRIYTPADAAASSDAFKNAAIICEGRTLEEIEAMGRDEGQ